MSCNYCDQPITNESVESSPLSHMCTKAVEPPNVINYHCTRKVNEYDTIMNIPIVNEHNTGSIKVLQEEYSKLYTSGHPDSSQFATVISAIARRGNKLEDIINAPFINITENKKVSIKSVIRPYECLIKYFISQIPDTVTDIRPFDALLACSPEEYGLEFIKHYHPITTFDQNYVVKSVRLLLSLVESVKGKKNKMRVIFANFSTIAANLWFLVMNNKFHTTIANKYKELKKNLETDNLTEELEEWKKFSFVQNIVTKDSYISAFEVMNKDNCGDWGCGHCPKCLESVAVVNIDQRLTSEYEITKYEFQKYYNEVHDFVENLYKTYHLGDWEHI